MNFKIFGRIITIAVTVPPSTRTLGVTNETEDGFIPFIDYDDILYKKVVEDIRRVQKVFSLDAAYVLSTKEETINGETCGNYHVVFFDVVPHGLIQEILYWTRCDPRYRSYWRLLYQKNWVLRVGERLKDNGFVPGPKFKECIFPKHRSYVYRKSRAYYLFYKKHFKGATINTNFLNDKTVTLISYLTGK